MFVILNLQTVFYVPFMGACVVYLSTESHKTS
jgi:hypothetical protein